MLAAFLLAGCGSGAGTVPDGSDQGSGATSDGQGGESLPESGGEGEQEHNGNGGGGQNPDPGPPDGGGQEKSIEVSSPLLSGFYPEVFGEFRDEERVQCRAVNNEGHPGTLRVTRVETSARRSSPKVFFVGSKAGRACNGLSQAGAAAQGAGPCQGAELPRSGDQLVFCELWVELRPDAVGDYYGAVAITVEGDCAAGEEGGPICAEARDRANSPVERPITFRSRHTLELRACLAEPRPRGGGEFERSCDELRAEQGLTSSPSEESETSEETTDETPEETEDPVEEFPADSPPPAES
ncbi:hypothetical protein Misp01_11180 [Microtetraspora sp. NBRC 13810]|nr:hypothetical protein Misp01_11180 [Microtetraspora sp. NBRC 13810]